MAQFKPVFPDTYEAVRPEKADKHGELVEVGASAVWSLSSAKPGFGIEQIRDNNLETYWQSDGPQPHTINIQWVRRTNVQLVSLYVDYSLDESYTPFHIVIRAGTTFHDLKDIKAVELEEPTGWVHIPLATKRPVRCHLIQIAILTNHQNGRDSHLRQVKVYGPSWQTANQHAPSFSSVDYNLYSTIR